MAFAFEPVAKIKRVEFFVIPLPKKFGDTLSVILLRTVNNNFFGGSNLFGSKDFCELFFSLRNVNLNPIGRKIHCSRDVSTLLYFVQCPAVVCIGGTSIDNNPLVIGQRRHDFL